MFTDLNRQLTDDIYRNHLQYKKWKGFRLCAIDGTSIRLPNDPDITDHFGIHKAKADQENCADEHLNHAGNNDQIIYDRGYNAFWLYAHHIKHNNVFCTRAKTNQSLVIKSFIQSGRK